MPTQESLLKEMYKNLSKELPRDVKDVASKRSLSATMEWVRTRIEELFNDHQDIATKEIGLLIGLLILLYRRGFLKELSHDPHGFIAEFCLSLFPKQDSNKVKIDPKLLNTIFEGYDNSIWSNIALPSHPEVSIYYWMPKTELGPDPNGISLYSIISNYESQSGEETELEYTVRSDYSDDAYDEYMVKVDRKLQTQVTQPDLIFVDSILLAEYESKGVFSTFEYHLPNKLSELPIWDITSSPEIQLGKTLNGYIEAIPITRNFHCPGRGEELNVDKSSEIIDVLDTIGGGDLKKLVAPGSYLFDYFTVKHVSQTHTASQLPYSCTGRNPVPSYGEINPNDEIEITLESFVVQMGDKNPLIPMQAGRGAHIVYTLFAYLSRISIEVENTSFITAKKPENKNQRVKLEVYNSKMIENRLKDFLYNVYCYIPVIALSLDHYSSGALRDNMNFNKKWFDPCLPIESEKFQQNIVKYSKYPINSDNGSPLSCLGGFCLAIGSKSDSKAKSAEFAFQLAQEYLTKSLDEGGSIKDHSCRIDYTGRKPQDYIETPSQIAKRPHFDGWRFLEEQISETTRIFMLTTMILRVILIEIIIILREIASENSACLDAMNKIYATQCAPHDFPDHKDYYKLFKQFYTVSSIEKYINDSKKIINKAYNTINQAEREQWIEANCESLVADKNTIYSLIQSALKMAYPKVSEVDVDWEKILIKESLEYIATQFSQTLVMKVHSLCVSHGWEVELIQE